ncbi:carbohydrate ABC transporter permease [Sanguibacter sp. HDW7]|uniref:carbohydrate ABC transporter permease n=1 Tax=Sanguibacter sp. HDW7 TaxID=2714931 RepID=UPI00140E4E6A|nr:sugar ABC transporter permease [Sanguibacter sp. HDW7]QIK84793.1 sugar ABC transporter permease [Sanguibacter sp. HDW7]
MIVAVLLFVGVMALLLWLVDRPRRTRNWLVAGAFAGPALLLVGFGLVYPALSTTKGSFYDKRGQNFIGLDNYVRAFTDPDFQVVLRNTIIWVVLVPLLSTLIGLVYAVLVDRTRFEKAAKSLVFLPMAISMVGASVIWKFVYEYREASANQIGLLNQVLVWVGLEPQQFLLNQPLNTLFLIIVMVWIQAGFAMTILSASIKAIPDDIVEAARLDGLYGFGMFRYITVPSIRPALVVVLTTIAMATLKVFDIVRTMTAGNFGTSVVANEFYMQSFKFNDKGMGAALAVLLFIFVIPLIVYNVRQMRKVEEIR